MRTQGPLRCLLVALLPLVAAACGGGQTSGNRPVAVTIQAVGAASESAGARYSANLEPAHQVNVDAQVSGTIVSITQVDAVDGAPREIQGGDPVTLGQTLATIHDATYRDQVGQAQAQLDAAKAQEREAAADYRRAKILVAKDYVSDADYDKALATYQSAQAQVASSRHSLDAAKVQLSYTTITSPLDGLMLDRNVEIGTLVSPGVTAFTVADTASMKAIFGVPAPVVSQLELGEPMTVLLQSPPDVERRGRITRISPVADSSTRVFDVEVTLANPDGTLLDGMVVTLQLPETLTAHGDLLVPLGAVVRPPDAPEKYAVFVAESVDDATVARLRTVELGDVLGDQIVVRRGLGRGDRVIVRGATLITDGEQVRVIP